MAKIFLETSDSARTANDNNDSFYGLAGDQVVTVKAKGITVDAAVERLVFAGQMSDYTFMQSGPNALKVMKGADTITTAFVQADANGTQLTFAGGTVDAVLGAGTITLGGTVVGTTAATVIPGTIDTSVTTPGDVTPPASTTSDLTVDQDNLLGTGGDDTFTGYIFDNQNTLQNGDVVNGGEGTDSLHVELGNSQAFAIQPRLTSVENIFIQAQATDISDYADNFNSLPLYSPLGDQGAPFSYNDASHDGYTQIDAGKIVGVRQLWSDDSRANLVIEDVSVDSHVTTIGMRDTDPGNVNYEVYFDPQNITGPGVDSAGGTLTISLCDVLNLADFNAPLNLIPYDGLILNIGATSVELDIDFTTLDTYADFKAAIDAQLAAKGVTSITVEVLPDRPIYFSDNVGTHVPTEYAGDYNQILLTNAGGETLDLTSYTQPVGAPAPDKNIFSTTSTDTPDTFESLTQVNIILDNVARGDASGSGDLVVGDMSESGIQQFNVQVDRSSHIDQLASTNNVLEVINVENIGAEGDLIINRIDDVRVFDASAMVGDVTLGAYLSENITEKYLDLKDTATNPADDNSELDYTNVVDNEFSYDLGNGDDTLDLGISSNNLSDAGTTNREDFVLEVNGFDGDDDITLAIVDEEGDLANANAFTLNDGVYYANWYDNSVLNANLAINGGAGNDTIWTPGSGNVVIDGESGNDTIYADNTGAYPITGRMANFIFNTNSLINNYDVLDNLQSDANNKYKIYNGKLTVSFQGFEVTVNLPSTSGVVSDLQVNQAIKAAINGNDVLNKLIVAHDGPANTLVVKSLIDGEMSAADLTVSIAVPTTLTSSDVILLNGYYGTTNGVAADHLATFNAAKAAFDAKLDYDTEFARGPGLSTFQYFGVDSEHTSDNIITGGTGNDVIVLGTGEFSNDTIVYNGFGNGTDSIVNFQVDHEFLTVNDPIVDIENTSYTQGAAAVVQVTAPVAEQFVVEFSAATVGGLVTFDTNQNDIVDAGDVTVTTTAGMSATAVRDLFVTIGTAGAFTITANADGTATFTETTPAGADILNYSVSDFLVNGAPFTATPTNSGVVTAVVSTVDGETLITVPGVSAGTETFTLVFSNADDFSLTNPQYITFDGEQIPVLPNELGTDIAAAVGTGIYTNWDVTNVVGNVVTFTSKTANTNVPDGVVLADQMDGDSTPDAFIVPNDAITGMVTFTNADQIDFSSYNVAAVYVGSTLMLGGLSVANDKYIQLVESTTNDGSYTIYEYDAVNGFAGTGTDADILLGTVGIADFGVEQAFSGADFII